MLSSCGGGGGEPEPSLQEKAKQNLTASPWKVISVTVDGVDKTSLFTGFTITFTSAPSFNYTTTNGGAVWPSSGGWSFSDSDGKALNFSGVLPIQLTTLTETSLVMSFAWNKNTFGSGRSGSIKGNHVFTMGK
jgi:hypothetical protein